MKRCPNCKRLPKPVKDRYFKYALEHPRGTTCPMLFQVAAHTKKQLAINLTKIYYSVTYQYRVRRAGFHDYVIGGFPTRDDAKKAMQKYIRKHPSGNLGRKSRGWVSKEPKTNRLRVCGLWV